MVQDDEETHFVKEGEVQQKADSLFSYDRTLCRLRSQVSAFADACQQTFLLLVRFPAGCVRISWGGGLYYVRRVKAGRCA